MDIFSNFEWHSSCPLDTEFGVSRNAIRRLANSTKNRMAFLPAGDKFLIHKSKKALWKISEDGNSIVPVFATDVLDESDMEGVS